MKKQFKAFHGTAWTPGTTIMSHSMTKTGIMAGNDMGVAWASENWKTAEWFSERQATIRKGQEVLLELAIDLSDKNVYHSNDEDMEFEVGGFVYDIQTERDQLYEALQNEGYDAFVIERHHGDAKDSPGCDVAIFNEDCFSVVSARIKADGKWSLPISKQETFDSVIEHVERKTVDGDLALSA